MEEYRLGEGTAAECLWGMAGPDPGVQEAAGTAKEIDGSNKNDETKQYSLETPPTHTGCLIAIEWHCAIKHVIHNYLFFRRRE